MSRFKPVKITSDMVGSITNARGGLEQVPPTQCQACGRWVTGKTVGKTWYEVKVDLDAGDAERGPNPDIQDVIVCPECKAKMEDGSTFHDVIDMNTGETMNIEKVIDGLVEASGLHDVDPEVRQNAANNLRRASRSKAKIATQEELDALWAEIVGDGENENAQEEFDISLAAALPGYKGVWADREDVQGLVDGFKEACDKLGITVLTNPVTQGGDSFGFLLFKK